MKTFKELLEQMSDQDLNLLNESVERAFHIVSKYSTIESESERVQADTKLGVHAMEETIVLFSIKYDTMEMCMYRAYEKRLTNK